MKNKPRNIIRLLFMVLLGIIMFASAEKTFAMDRDALSAKATYEGVYKCIGGGAYKGSWNSSKGAGGFINGSAKDMELVKLPYDLTAAISNSIDCKEVMLGWNGVIKTGLQNGLIPKNIQITNNPESIKDYFSSLGYDANKINSVSEGTEWQQMIIEAQDGYEFIPGAEQDDLHDKTKIVFPKLVKKEDGSWWTGDTNISSFEGVDVPEAGSGERRSWAIGDQVFEIQEHGSKDQPFYSFVTANMGGEINIMTDGNSYEIANGKEYVFTDGSSIVITIQTGKTTQDDDDFKDYKMEWQNKPIDMVKGLNENNGIGYKVDPLKSYNDLKFTDQEVYDLYTYYVRDIFQVEVVCKGESKYQKYKNAKKINWVKGKTCRYDNATSITPDHDVYGVDPQSRHFGMKLNSVDDAVAMLSKLDLNKLNTLRTGGDLDDPDTDKDGDSCRNAEGAKSLGWLLCPILELMGNAAEGMYANVVEPSLQVQPELLNGNSNNSNNSVREAWTTFRDIANVLFIIVLLVVIFSQLTGVGIDNYGIKKILPRLIVVAILINLSYFLCVLLVDLSNILGSGFQAMFKSLGAGLSPKVNLAAEGSSVGPDGHEFNSSSMLAGLGVFGVLVGAVGAIWASPAILLSLFISGIGVFVSIVFLFVLLAARKAAIIVLIVTSPLAVIAYMLPNTKSMFEKWWKFFEGLLMVYPIAGLLVGAGDYVSRLLLTTSDGFFAWITAMIVGVAPVFFIPMVLKGAFAAMGKVGGMLAGFGNTASRTAQKQVRARGGEIGRKIGSTDTFRGFRNKIGMKSPLSTKRMRARAVQDQAALLKEQSARNKLADTKTMDTRLASIASAEEAKAVDEATGQRLSLMQSDPTNGGGIHLGRGIDGVTERAVSFTPDSATERMEELEQIARGRSLNNGEQQELAALARGMANMSGGGSAMARIIRGAKDENGNVNSNFMKAMGQIYSRDSSVQSKLNEKDAGVAAYTEKFMPGGNGDSVGTFDNYKTTKDYTDQVDKRVKTYAAGLNQSDPALQDYVEKLSDDDVRNIKNDKMLFNSLDRKAQEAINNRITNPENPINVNVPQQVQIVGSVPPGTSGSGGSTGSPSGTP